MGATVGVVKWATVVGQRDWAECPPVLVQGNWVRHVLARKAGRTFGLPGVTGRQMGGCGAGSKRLAARWHHEVGMGAHDDRGRLKSVTSYDGDDCPLNQVFYDDDPWGEVVTSWQSHSGPANTDGPDESPSVRYEYDGAGSGAVPHVRLTSVTYPDGRELAYYYTGDAISDKLSRVSSIGDLQDPYARFTYLGADMIVEVDHPAVTGGLKLSYGADGAAGLDGLGRVVDQKWTTGEGETLAVVDRFGYTYDLAGNRLTRDVGAAPFEQDLFDEKYTYDALNRLTNVERGRLYCGDITASTLTQDWTLDAVGNWDGFAWDPDGDGSAEEVAQTREHDAANQLTGFTTGPTWVTPAYDAAGNMTLAPKPGDEYHGLALTYDAWNRLVRVSGGATPVAEYQYDGLNRRTAKLVFDAPSDTWTRTDSYLNEAWQVLEERVATAVLAADKGQVATDASVQYLWDPRYIDMPILRWRNANVEDPDLEETLYYTTDANFNVTALIDGSTGDPTERYIYDAYGTVTILNPDWSAKVQNVSDFDNNILYTGAPLDRETGLILMRRRYYDPSLGVFASKDPIGLAGGNANLYGYASSNPVARVDLMGLSDESVYDYCKTVLQSGMDRLCQRAEQEWEWLRTYGIAVKDEVGETLGFMADTAEFVLVYKGNPLADNRVGELSRQWQNLINKEGYLETVAPLLRIPWVAGANWPTSTPDAERREGRPWLAPVSTLRMRPKALCGWRTCRLPGLSGAAAFTGVGGVRSAAERPVAAEWPIGSCTTWAMLAAAGPWTSI